MLPDLSKRDRVRQLEGRRVGGTHNDNVATRSQGESANLIRRVAAKSEGRKSESGRVGCNEDESPPKYAQID
jgi:hypothetical protein